MANLLRRIKAGLLRLPLFVFSKRRKHPMYVYKLKKDKFKGLLLTHSNKLHGKKNMKLNKNPNLSDNKKAYIQKRAYLDDESSFGNLLRNYQFDKSDKGKIRYLKRINKKR